MPQRTLRMQLIAGVSLAFTAAPTTATIVAPTPEIVTYQDTNVCLELPRQSAGTSTDRLKFIGTQATASDCADAATAWRNQSAPMGRDK